MRQRAPLPVVTVALVVLNLVGFALELGMGDGLESFLRRWGLVPADTLEPAALVTLLTSMFLHAGWLHLVSNMVYLGVFGPAVEFRLGALRYAALYVAAGLVGSVAYLLAQPTSQAPAIGASGAIAGVIAAHLVLYPGATLGSVSPVVFSQVVGGTPILVLLLIWLATQLLSGVASLTSSTGVAWWAHLGGFLTGLTLATLLRTRTITQPKKRQ